MGILAFMPNCDRQTTMAYLAAIKASLPSEMLPAWHGMRCQDVLSKCLRYCIALFFKFQHTYLLCCTAVQFTAFFALLALIALQVMW